jgi:uncharacterized protein
VPSPAAIWAEGCRLGELRYQWDPEAQLAIFYPRVLAPGTGAIPEWRVSTGRGTIYSRTVIRRRDGQHASVVLVDLDEGFRILSRVDGMPAEEVQIGMRVRVRFDDGEPPVPAFVPDRA